MARTQRGQCIRFDPALHERIKAAADEREMSVNQFVGKIVAEGLDRLIPADELSLTRKDAANA